MARDQPTLIQVGRIRHTYQGHRIYHLHRLPGKASFPEQEDHLVSFATINGINLHYRLLGDPHGGPVLVLINSLGTDFRIWEAVIEPLSVRFPVLAYDKRGHGLSASTPLPYTMGDHVADLAGLLDRLGIGEVVLCGVSVGGLVALGFQEVFPA